MSKLSKLLSHGTTVYFQPDPMRIQSVDTGESVIQKRLAVLVGSVAFLLPVIMATGAVVGGSCFRDSISHFYYAQFLGPIFVGMLVFIGGFLIAYTGDHWLEDLGSVIAGVGACFVAIFPTTGNGCEGKSEFLSRVFVTFKPGSLPDITPVIEPIVASVPDRDFFQLFVNIENIHSYAAAVLFIYLGLYCLVVLKRIVPERHMFAGEVISTKQRRNTLYSLCGLVILSCVAILGAVGFLAGPDFLSTWKSYNLTFVFEAIALWAFGLAWAVKGRWFERYNETALG